MARRKPRCALCGGDMRQPNPRGAIEVKYEAYPHMPGIGWHADCLKKDKRMWKRVLGDLKTDGRMKDEDTAKELRAILGAINARGRGRVVRNKSRLCRPLHAGTSSAGSED